MPLPIDALSGAELAKVDAWRQAEFLSDLCAEIGRLGHLRAQCSNALYDAKILACESSTTANKQNVLRAQKAMERCKAEIQQRKEQVKIIQTLIRSVPQ